MSLKPSAPKAPDPVVTAQAQTGSNLATATAQSELNNINQTTPYGSSTYTQDGTYPDGTPKWSQSTTLSPEQQNLLNMTQQGETALGNAALGGIGNIQSTFGTPFSYGGPSVTGNVANSGAIASSLPSAGNIQNGVDTSGVNPLQSNIQNQSNSGITGRIGNGANNPWAIGQAENAAYNTQAQYLDPQFSRAHGSLDAKLANMGLSSGDRGYDAAQSVLGEQENQAYGNAGNQAVLAGQNEQNTLFGQGVAGANLQNSANAQGFGQGLAGANLQNQTNQQGIQNLLSLGQFGNQAQEQQFGQNLAGAGFQNTAQGQQYGQNLSNAGFNNTAAAQALQQQLALRNQPLNEYNALASGSQVTLPQFGATNPATMAGTNTAQITQNGYQNQLQAYQQQMAGINNLFGLGGQLGAAAIMSDRRVKRDIVRVGSTSSGIPTYTFRYNNDDAQTYFGVMADEVAHIPGAVIRGHDGYDRVDYSRVK